MPEHFHLLISEPERGAPSTVMQVLKQRFARRLHWKTSLQDSGISLETVIGQVWQERFYDFNVWTRKKEVEKLRYMHRNPVKRGLVEEQDQWAWSSFRSYAYHEPGIVRINFPEYGLEGWRAMNSSGSE
jgi:putative transposase